MNYDALDAQGPRGEVLLRGPQTFQGYYKNEKGARRAGARGRAPLAAAGLARLPPWLLHRAAAADLVRITVPPTHTPARRAAPLTPDPRALQAPRRCWRPTAGSTPATSAC
jgi:hypothetical protein